MSDIMAKWADAIDTNSAVQSFCIAKYDKPLTIYTCHNQKPPTEQHCPHVVMFPDSGNSGLEQGEYVYRFIMGWVIYNKNEVVIGNKITYPGMAECETLGRLIWDCIKELNPEYPLGKGEIEYHPQFFPQFKALMEITLTVPVYLGVDAITPY